MAHIKAKPGSIKIVGGKATITLGLSKSSRKSLAIRLNSAPGFACQGKVGSFMDAYCICESVASRLVEIHKKVDLKRTPGTREIQAAIKAYDLNVIVEDTRKIFLGKPIDGVNTARFLRNRYIHSLSPHYKAKIEENHTELIKLLDRWRAHFRAAIKT